MLYPANTIITKEGWKGQEIFILVHGQVTFSTGDQELATFAAGEKGFSFGEEGMLLLTAFKGLYMYVYDTTVKE
ncbi:unnamed protein product [Porites evermanni]|uniref:Cyclic nucleotide-binding domain-containing protein n=1 Tax=Porites evermanni TaxID=104178 RepID=A0ABN8SZP4_9CNID|nr:unnamed protein product [Porites evermanni]